VHSSNCGALLRLCEAICDLCRFSGDLTSTWPSRALSHVDITLSAVAFRPGRHSWLGRHRDPALVGVSYTVPVESSFLHCIGTDELSKEGTFRFRRGSCEQRRKHSNVALIPRIVNFFRQILRSRCRPRTPSTLTESGGISRGAMRAPLPILRCNFRKPEPLQGIAAS
jgi:hypothetical protein